MVSFQLLYVSCYYTKTPPQLTNPSSCPVGNLCNAVIMFLSLGLFILFDHLFEDGMLSIVVLSFLVLL